MKKRIPESWLSAYLDGELAADRAALVVRLAQKHPAVARRLDELRRVKEAVASLPKAKLAGDNRRRLWRAVLEHPEVCEARKTALSASLDNELTPDQAVLLERTATDAELRYAGKLAEVRDALRELPKFVAPKAAVEGAMAQIRFEALQSLEAAAELRELPLEAAPTGLLEDVVHEVKPLAPTPSFRVFAFRREGWATGLAAAFLTGICLFIYALPGPGPFGDDLVATLPPPIAEDPKTPSPPAPKTLLPPRPLLAGNAPTINEPFDDFGPEDLKVKPQEPKPELPASFVAALRPGVKYEVPGTKFTFLCLDVTKMADRVRVVYLKHRAGGGKFRYAEEDNGTIVSVEMEATPTQLAGILTDLKDTEEAAVERLIAEVKVSQPRKPQVVDDSFRLTQEPAITNIRTPVVGAEPPRPAPPGDAPKVAKGDAENSAMPKAPVPAVGPLAPDAPRQYVLIFRRQDAVPPSDPRRG